ncbi:glycosyltransferase, partial [Actinomyces sp. MRS3W]|uniref:glycosyltransferase n=1 Tax=Actinomyces sp. MRS3W TaxID=2800796 RepID=UPI0028FD9991
MIERVVFSVDNLGNLGGVQTAVDELASELSARGFEVSYMTLSPQVAVPRVPGSVFEVDLHKSWTSLHPQAAAFPGPLGARLALKTLLSRPWRLWRDARLRRYVHSLGPGTAIVFAQMPTLGLLVDAGYEKRAGDPLIIAQVHTSPEGARLWGSEETIRRAAPHLDALLALDPDDAQEFADLTGAPVGAIANPSSVVRPGGLERSHPPELCYVGRLSDEKRVDLLIRGFDIASCSHPGWRLVIHGDGVERENLQRLASACDHADRIELRGRTSDVTGVLSGAQCNVLVSRFEGLPMSVIEAARCGTPTAAIPVSAGLSSLLDRCGYRIEGATEQAVAEALERVMGDEAGRLAKQDAALRTGADFAPAVIADQWEQIFEH